MAHLVFQTAFPGDLFLSIPLIKNIRAWDPGTSLVLACRPGLGGAFLKSGLVDEVLEIDKRTPAGRKEAHRRLRAETWDAIFVPHSSVRTALWLLPVKARLGKVAFHQWWNGLGFSHRVVKPMHLPDALRQLSLLTALDSSLAERFAEPDVLEPLRNPTVQNPIEDFRDRPIPEWASMRMREHRSQPRMKKIFLAPGSVWNTKRWTLTGYRQLADLLIKKGYVVELVGSGAEKALCDEVASQVRGVVNRAGQTTLDELLDLFSTGAALVCNDSGAMHVAAAAALPTLALFGPTVLAQGFRPWQRSALVMQRELRCRPCGAHGSERCPIGTHECMTEIRAQDVLKSLESLL